MAKNKGKTKKTGITKSSKSSKSTPVLKTRVALILDRSGSMGGIRAEALQMFNDQVKSLKEGTKKGMDTKVSFATFSTVADAPVLFNQDVSELRPLTLEQYVPNGWTAMYDGVGRMIDALSATEDAKDPNCSFLIIVVSDGAENYSREYTAAAIAERVKTLQGTKRWTFSYMGANQDLSVISQTLNIPIGNTYAFTSSSAGTTIATSVNSASTRGFMRGRAGGQTSSANFYSTPDTGSGTTGSGSNVKDDTKETK